MSASTVDVRPALPDEELAMRALVRVGVMITGAVAAVGAVLGIVHAALLWAGDDRSVGAAFDTALGASALMFALAAPALRVVFAQGRASAAISWGLAAAAAWLATTAFLQAGEDMPSLAYVVSTFVFAAFLLAWFALAPLAAERAGVVGPGMRAFASAIAAVGAAAVVPAVIAVVTPSAAAAVAAAFAIGIGGAAAIAIPVWWILAAFRLFPRR